VGPYTINLISGCFFLYITIRIASYLRKIEAKARANVYDSQTHEVADCVTKARKDALCNLRLVVIPILFNSFYQWGFSLTLLFATNENCHMVGVSTQAGNVLNATNRSMNYVWWVIPIIYVLWPRRKQEDMIEGDTGGMRFDLLTSENTLFASGCNGTHEDFNEDGGAAAQ